MMENVILSLGSNIGNREAYINKAVALLGNDPAILIDKVSSFYETSPVGNVNQRAFINIALKIATTDSPEDLLTKIHQIELHLHRTVMCIGDRGHWMLILFFGVIKRLRLSR